MCSNQATYSTLPYWTRGKPITLVMNLMSAVSTTHSACIVRYCMTLHDTVYTWHWTTSVMVCDLQAHSVYRFYINLIDDKWQGTKNA